MSPSSLKFPGNFFLIILTSFFVVGDSARILGLFSTISKSHLFIHCAVADALAERGHDVTVVTTLPLIKKKHRFRHIHLEVPGDLANFLSVEINDTPPWYRRFTRFAGFVTDYAEKSLNHPKMRKLMAEESFDLMLHGYFLNELLFGVAGHFKCPLVVILTVQSTSITNFFVGNPQEISYVPSLLSGAKQPLDFVGRVKNFFFVSVVEQLMLRKLIQWYQVDTYGDGARILGLFITHGKSHLIIHTAIANALAERGHNVTVVSTIPLLRKSPNIRHIQMNVTGFSAKFYAKRIDATPPWYKHVPQIIGMITEYANRSLNELPMQKLMKEESFDLVIQGYLANEFLLGVAAHFKCPVVMSLMVRPIDSVNVLLGNPSELAYVPSLLGGGKQPMGFVNRLRNFFYVNLVEKLVVTYYYQWYQKLVYTSNFPPNKYPSFDEVKKNVSLILTNHHFSQTPIRPNVPAMVEIGGIQIKEKPDPLPEDIKSILDNSTKHGVVYFSLGTNVQGSFLDQSKVKVMFDVLSKLQQTVLWKWSDSDPVPGKSPNIIYKSWLPQDDILAQKNVKLFVTHGGQGSVVESQYHGVPMVGIPLFGEQSSNMENVVKEGFGLSVDYLTITEKNFNSAVHEVLSNKKYIENVQRFSKLYKDRPMTAKETAVFWVEYVLRHHGAPHMQSPAVHLNIFQLLSLDVIGFLLAALYISWRVIKAIVLLIFYVFRKNKSKVD